MKNNQILSNLIPYTIILIVFIIDLYTKLGYAVGVLYIFSLFILALQNNKKLIYAVTFITITLTCVVYFIYAKEYLFNNVLFNRVVSILLIFSTTLLIQFKEKLLNVKFTQVDSIDIQALQVLEEIDGYAIILLDIDEKINNWNKGAENIFGYKTEDIIHLNVSQLLSEKDKSENFFFHLIEKVKNGQESKDNIWLKRKNGSLFWSEIKVKAILNEKGQIIGISLIVHDIDSKRSLEQLLSATNSLAKVGGWEYDLITDKLFWSDTTKEIHEVDKDYIPNTTEGINFYKEGEDRDRITRVFSNMIETGVPFEEELRIVTAKNKVKWIRTKAYPIMVEGLCKKIYGSFQDIHDLKEKELSLTASEDRFKKIFKHSPNGMARVSLEGKVLEANESYYKLVGYNAEELSKLTIKDITHPDDVATDLENFIRLKNGEIESFQIDKRLYNKNGVMKWANAAVSRITKTNDATDYFIAQLTDITERKNGEQRLIVQQEQLLEKNKELNQYAYITSHDLQEPVRTINSFSQLLNEQYSNVIDENGKKYLRFINEASVRLKDQIKGLLDYSRLGKQDKVAQITNLNDIVKYVQLDLNILIKEKNATIHTEDLPTLAVYDTEFKLLLQNLITNAIKFQQKDKHPVIHVSAKEKVDSWLFCVEDNGIGMEEKFYEKIFQIFQRLHGRKEFEGSGIGLAHCKKIVELHKGKIWVESELNKGSKFWFTINKNL